MISLTRWISFFFLCSIILNGLVKTEVIQDWSVADKGKEGNAGWKDADEDGNDYADEYLEPGQDYADVDGGKYGQAPPASEWMDYL